MIYVTNVFSLKMLAHQIYLNQEAQVRSDNLLGEPVDIETGISIVSKEDIKHTLGELDLNKDYTLYSSNLWSCKLIESELGIYVKKSGHTELDFMEGDIVYVPHYSGRPLDGYDKNFKIPEDSTVTWYEITIL